MGDLVLLLTPLIIIYFMWLLRQLPAFLEDPGRKAKIYPVHRIK